MSSSAIPIRNIWLLLLYASQLFKETNGNRRIELEENIDELPKLLAEILCHLVTNRLKRNLSHGHHSIRAELGTVRGRILLLATERKQLLKRGRIACQFTTLTINRPRYRLVRAALNQLSSLLKRTANPDKKLFTQCAHLARKLETLGVSGSNPTESELMQETLAHHERADRELIATAQLVFSLALPSETQGNHFFIKTAKDEDWLRRLFEQAVGGFYKVVLAETWKIETGTRLYWPCTHKTKNIDKILPSMKTDITLSKLNNKQQRIVIDTKFTAMLKARHYNNTETLKSENLYQMYAYLRTQAAKYPHTIGVLLYPAIDEDICEGIALQGHELWFRTIDLNAQTQEIRKQLLDTIEGRGTLSLRAAEPSIATAPPR